MNGFGGLTGVNAGFIKMGRELVWAWFSGLGWTKVDQVWIG